MACVGMCSDVVRRGCVSEDGSAGHRLASDLRCGGQGFERLPHRTRRRRGQDEQSYPNRFSEAEKTVATAARATPAIDLTFAPPVAPRIEAPPSTKLPAAKAA